MTHNPAAGYVRCSTDKQEVSIDDQKSANRRLARESDDSIEFWYEDEGRSGTSVRKRPDFRRLLQDVESGRARFRTLYCYSMDRFGRFPDPDDTLYYIQHLKRHGVTVRFVKNSASNEPGTAGRLNRLLDSEKATGFSKDQSVDVLRGSKTNAGRGYSVGGLPPYGYAREVVIPETGVVTMRLERGQKKGIKEHRVRFTPGDPHEVSIVRRVFDLRGNKRYGYRQIANILNSEGEPSPTGGKWGKAYISHMLQNPAYMGTRVYNRTSKSVFLDKGRVNPKDQWITKEDAHPAIIEPELFNRVQDMVKTNRRHFEQKSVGGRAKSRNYLLTGLIWCKQCGRSFHGRKNSNGQGGVWFRYEDSGPDQCGDSACSRFVIDRDYFEESVVEVLSDNVLPAMSAKRVRKHVKKFLIRKNTGSGYERRGLRQRITRIEREIENLAQAIANGAQSPTLLKKLKALENEKASNLLRLDQIESKRLGTTALSGVADQIMAQVKQLRGTFRKGKIAEAREQIGNFIEKIEVDKAAKTAKVHFYRFPLVNDSVKSWLERDVTMRSMPEAGIVPVRTV